MKTNIMLYNTERNKSVFELRAGTRPWGILLAISKGSFRLSFPDLKKSEIISPYEIAYVPPNTAFCREVIEPIDFHQFTFQIGDDDSRFQVLAAGKLNIPKEQVRASLNSAAIISDFPMDSDRLVEHMLHRILTDAYLFSHTVSLPQISPETACAIRYISEHLHEPLSVAALAASLHLSHNGLIWKFKQELHTTPMRYIAACRIKRAKQLLFEGSLTMSRIAEACGFSNAYYFSNAFKKSEGISPSNFRGKCIK